MAQLRTTSDLLGQLNRVLTTQRIVLFSAGLLLTLFVFGALWILLSLVANVMVVPVWVKLPLLIAAAAATGYSFFRYPVKNLFSGSVDAVAVELEQRHADLKGRLIAAVQFARAETPEGYSRDLIEATHRQAVEIASGVNLNEAVSYHPLLKSARWFSLVAAAVVAFLVFSPGFFGHSLEVYSNPTTEVAPPLGYTLVANPGSIDWIKYRDLNIGAVLVGGHFPEKAIVHYRFAGGNWQEHELLLKQSPRVTLEIGDSVTAVVALRQVNRSLDYYVESGKLKTDVQSVNVVDRPRVEELTINIFPPAYTKLTPTTINENNGSFSAIVGSRVSVAIGTNLPVTQAELIFDDSSRVPVQLTSGGKRGELSLVIDQNRNYYIRLKDHLGESNPDPIQYAITAIPDAFPQIDVIRPGYDANLNDAMVLPVLLRIQDDFGFSSLVMKYTIVRGGNAEKELVAALHYPEQIKTEGEVDFSWDMEPLRLSPGDYVGYHFEIADNDKISGPKITQSRQYIARFPSLAEITSQLENAGQERIKQTEDLAKTGKELAQRLKNAARALDAKNREAKSTDWQQQKELEAITQKNEELVQKLDQMAKSMDESIEKTQENALMSRQIMEKMQQLQKLFEEVATPEMREAQEKLMEALKKMNRDEIQKAMKDFQMSQKEMLDRLERTLALLKKLQMEQKMEAMVRKAEQLVKEQKELADKSKEAESSQLPSMSKQQEKTKEGLESLKKEVDELKQAMQEAKMQDSQEAQKFAESVEKTDAQQDMQESSDAMKQQNKEAASKQSSSAHKKLSDMLNEMQQQQMAMQGKDNSAMERAMHQAMDDANSLSQNQEQLLREAAAMQQGSMAMRDMAQQQQDLEAATEGLKGTIAELGKQSPYIAAELEQLVNSASQQMDNAMQHLDSKNGVMASQQQRDAMTSLNKASNRLMESLSQQKQCNNPNSQCNSGMPKLESLAQKQQQLNQKTNGMCKNPGPNPGQGNSEAMGRDGLQRLAAEQGTIRKSMEELEQEFAGSRQILGRLDDISKEMKKVEEDLADGEVGEETMQRQLQVYSRMLEATRSLQRKDYTEQRQSTSAGNAPIFLPSQLPSELLGDKSQFEDRLKKFLGDTYPPQYQEQIKAYFRSLLQVETPQTTTQQAPSK